MRIFSILSKKGVRVTGKYVILCGKKNKRKKYKNEENGIKVHKYTIKSLTLYNASVKCH